MSIKKSVNALINIYAAPTDLFNEIKDSKGPTWIPLLLTVGLTIFVILFFYSNMTPSWLVEQQLLHITDASEAELDEMRNYLQESTGSIGVITAVFTSFYALAVYIALAGYYRVVFLNDLNRKFSDWFKFSVWIQMPMAIYAIAFLALILSAESPDLPIMYFNYSSANQLFINTTLDSPYYTLLESINLFYVWNIILSVVGLKIWMATNTAKAIIISILPYLVVFGIWAITL